MLYTLKLTALEVAIVKGNVDMALTLIDCGAEVDHLLLALLCKFNQISVVKKIATLPEDSVSSRN